MSSHPFSGAITNANHFLTNSQEFNLRFPDPKFKIVDTSRTRRSKLGSIAIGKDAAAVGDDTWQLQQLSDRRDVGILVSHILLRA